MSLANWAFRAQQLGSWMQQEAPHVVWAQGSDFSPDLSSKLYPKPFSLAPQSSGTPIVLVPTKEYYLVPS